MQHVETLQNGTWRKHQILYDQLCYMAILCHVTLLSECSYYEGVQKCLGLAPNGGIYTSEQVQKLEQVYNDLCKKYPRSAAAKVRL